MRQAAKTAFAFVVALGSDVQSTDNSSTMSLCLLAGKSRCLLFIQIYNHVPILALLCPAGICSTFGILGLKAFDLSDIRKKDMNLIP